MAVISLEERRHRELELNPRSSPYAPWMHIDLLLVLAAAGLAGIGIAAIYSTLGPRPGELRPFFLERQSLFAVAGGLFLVFAAWFHIRS